jgi:hypothetical protein
METGACRLGVLLRSGFQTADSTINTLVITLDPEVRLAEATLLPGIDTDTAEDLGDVHGAFKGGHSV